MSHSPAIPFEVSSGREISMTNGNGNGHRAATESATRYSFYSTLANLPGHARIFGVEETGEEVGRLFSKHVDLPGVIIFDADRFVGVISQAHFYKCVSRAFGREIYYRRPAAIMLTETTVQPLILSSDCPIQAAVDQCLARPADFVYEPFLIQDKESGQYRLCAFQNLLLASSQLAALRNQQMEQILNTVTDGLLVIDKNFRIGSEYSRVVGTIFERSDLQDVSLPDVFQPLVDANTHEQLRDYLKILFDPKLIDRLIKSINPAKQITARFSSQNAKSAAHTKHFALNFERIRSQTEISQVLVRIEDITQRMNLARELAQQEAAAEQRLQLVMQILQAEPTALNRFLAHFNSELVEMEQLVVGAEEVTDTKEIVHTLFRKAHTLKGEASLLRLAAHARALHQLEDRLDELRSAPVLKRNELASLAPSLVNLQELSDQIRQALDQLKALQTTDRPQATAEANGAQVEQAAGMVETLERLISDLSDQLGKPVAFHASLKEEDVPRQYVEALKEALMHLARNSMVHGIEAPDERLMRGKNAQAIIQLGLRIHPDTLEIIFQDDGGGLNSEKIRRRAEKLGWNLVTDEEVRQAIFEPGFSTADKVTDLAGRGVGLDIIRHTLGKLGGRIVAHSEQGAYCAFQILLPKPSVTHPL